MIRFLSAEGNRAAEIHRRLVAVYGECVMTRQNVMKWVHEFKEVRMEVHDEERSGHPSVVSDGVLQ